MKRYYLSKIKQGFMPGTDIPVYRHRFQEIGPNVPYVGGEIAVDPTTGVPVQKALLILVDVVDHRPFATDEEMAEVPEVSMDSKVASVASAAVGRFRAKAQQLGMSKADLDNVINGAAAFRDVIDRLGRLNNPAFSSRNFDLG